jgi:hypothetical protein
MSIVAGIWAFGIILEGWAGLLASLKFMLGERQTHVADRCAKSKYCGCRLVGEMLAWEERR